MREIARSQAALMAKFAKFAMRAAWLRAISHTTPARHYIMFQSIVAAFGLLAAFFAKKLHKLQKKTVEPAVPDDRRPSGALVFKKYNVEKKCQP